MNQLTEEKYSYDKYTINYTLSKNAFSDKLIVIFSAMQPLYSTELHPYNFQNVLSTFPANILYIKDDYGNRGCYYLCYNGDFALSDAVCALVQKICKQCSIKIEDVITLGSSKGGTAALHIGLKLNCGHIIAAVPQIKIATYTKAVAQDVYYDMISSGENEQLFEKIDNYIANQLSKGYSSVIHLLTSENDAQYSLHIKSILPLLQSKKTNVISINNSMADHDDVVNYNPDFMVFNLLAIVLGCEVIKTDQKLTIKRTCTEYEIAVKVINAKEDTKYVSVINTSTFVLNDTLHIELSVQKKDCFKFSWNIYNWLKQLLQATIELDKGNAILTCVNQRELIIPIEYAVYQSSLGLVQHKYPYQKSNSFVLNLENGKIPTDFQLFCIDRFNRSSSKIRIKDVVFKNELQKIIFNTEYVFTITSDVLTFKLLPKETDKSSLYCFYVLKDNEIIHKGSYSTIPEITFKISEYGKYKVLYYIFFSGEREFMYSKTITYKKTSVNIFGSCVSRDLLEYDNNHAFTLGHYIARQSIISSVSAPLKQSDITISLDSNFQKRMVEMDLMKTAFDFLKSKPSDYLIIDLIDERFPLVFFNGSYFTASNEGIKGYGLFNSLNKLYKKISNGKLCIESNNVDDTIDIFCTKINELYTNDKIIIHRALLVDSYKDKNGKIVAFDKNHKKNNRRVNCVLSYMYDRIAKNFKGAYVIDEISETTADESHKWGLAPMHYEEAYYQRVLMRLEEIIKDGKLSY